MAKIPTSTNIDITEMVKRVAQGDELAFHAIFEAYKKVFFAAAFKMTHDTLIAEEIVQEVFVSIWVKRHLVAEAHQIEDYIFGILHNCVYQYFRRQARDFRLKSAIKSRQVTSEQPIEQLLIDKEFHQAYESVIEQLPSQQKLVFRLAKQEQLSREEIAKKLNLSPNTVRNHLSAAIEFLHKHLYKGVYGLLIAFVARYL